MTRRLLRLAPAALLGALFVGPPAQAADAGDDSCPYAHDGECDEPEIGTGECDAGTDATDCAAEEEDAAPDAPDESAGPDASADEGRPFTPEEQAEIDAFVEDNTVSTLYHELGHALVDLFDLPVLGREEDAADNLASLLMLSEQPDDRIDRMVQDSADVYELSEREAEEAGWQPDPSDFADVHSLDRQRYYELVCVVYGSDPERFQELADKAGLPADRQESCPADYAQAKTSWDALLAPHRSEGEPRGQVTMDFADPGEADAHLAKLAQDSALVQAIPGQVAAAYRLPADIAITFDHCDEENAWYSAEDRTITMCYELMESFERLIADDIRRR